MEWKARPRIDEDVWHLWFAWYPVDIVDAYAWMQWVQRKFISTPAGGFWIYKREDPPNYAAPVIGISGYPA